jgi:hypothetical protein
LRTRRATLALLRELAGIAQQIEQNLLEPHGVRDERTQILLGFHNEPVLVLLGELSRGVIDVARSRIGRSRSPICFENMSRDRLGKLVARRRGNATQLRRT